MPNPTSAPSGTLAPSAAKAAATGPAVELTHAHDSEAAVLGCALAYPQSAAEALDDLHPPDLHDPRHRAVLAALRALLAGPSPDAAGVVDPVLTVAALARQVEVRCDHWPALVGDLVASASVPPAAPHHRRLVLDALARRHALALADRLRQAATGPDTDPGSLQRLAQDGADALYTTAARVHRASHRPRHRPLAGTAQPPKASASEAA